MELLEGRTLRDLLAREAPLDPARAVSLMLQVCAAVGAAHEGGLIHRDLKPANIFIEQRANLPAVVKVLDFGVAKFVVEEQDDDYNTLTQVGAIIGTPRYMSPEQSAGVAALTPAADVYSLGIILYEMLTGVAPFNGDTPLAIALKQVSAAPPPMREAGVSISAELERTVLHALAKDPDGRPRDANELRRELHDVAERLGFEHAESLRAPTLDDLRNAGTESPSGHLVIDLATLRQVQAAAGNPLPAATDQKLKPVANPGNSSNRPEFDRVQVPLSRLPSQRSQLVIAAMIFLVVVLGSAVIAARWWRGADSSVGIAANSETTPTPTPTVSPSPTPTPVERPNPPPRRRRAEKPSTAKKVWNKFKGIFR
jgi:serine/threonine-protein kinase